MFARIVATAALFAAACGAAQVAIFGGCNNPAGNMCVEYTGTAYKDAQSLQKICVSQKAAFFAGAGCPT